VSTVWDSNEAWISKKLATNFKTMAFIDYFLFSSRLYTFFCHSLQDEQKNVQSRVYSFPMFKHKTAISSMTFCWVINLLAYIVVNISLAKDLGIHHGVY